MMTIVPNQDFKHGARTYLSGQEYDVPTQDAEYFVGCGWVGDTIESGEVTLEIQDGRLGHSSEVN